MHETIETIRAWCAVLADAWRARTDAGGVTDDTAMMGLMALAAVAVGGLVYALVTGAVGRIDLGF
ncbi:MAG TPA: hypothetical protein VF743_07525 [Acidimicrobiales bacterium]